MPRPYFSPFILFFFANVQYNKYIMTLKNLFQSKILKFILFLVVLYIFSCVWKHFGLDVTYFQKLLSRYPTLSGLIFVLLYVGTTTFIWFGPKDVLRISSAILLGAYFSTVVVWIGEMINAFIMFNLSRIMGQEYVEQRLRAKATKIGEMKKNSSLLSIIALRINPLVPFRIMDLGYGLTQTSFKKYLAGIAVVSFIRIYWLQYILAEPGTNLFTNISEIINSFMNNSVITADTALKMSEDITFIFVDYFIKNPVFLYYSYIYFLVVFVISIVAVIVRVLRKEKSESI